MNEVYRVQRQTGKELDWLMIHRIVLWEMIWREQAQREKLRAHTQAKGVLAPSQAARAVGCTHLGAADHATSQCRALFVHSDEGGWKGKGKGAIGASKPAGCNAWSELKKKAFHSLVASLAERLTAGHCGWCGSPDHRAPQCPSKQYTQKSGKPKAPTLGHPGAGHPAKPPPAPDTSGSPPKPKPKPSGADGGGGKGKRKSTWQGQW